jgi:hypothetical protein
MAINVSTLEANLTTKINATTGTTEGKEFLLLGKAVEAIGTAVSANSLAVVNNLSDLTNVGTARTNLGLGTMAVETSSDYLTTAGASAAYAPLAGATFTGAVNATDLTLSGNLTVNGTTTTVNSTTLDVADLNITIADGAANAAAANGAGLTVDGASATMLYTSATDTWDFNKAITGTYTNLQPVVNTNAAVTGATTFDVSKPMHHFDMTGAASFTGVNIAAGRTCMMVLDTTATPHTPTWGSDIKWPGATEPTWADSRYWIVSFTCLDGSIILASASGYTV